MLVFVWRLCRWYPRIQLASCLANVKASGDSHKSWPFGGILDLTEQGGLLEDAVLLLAGDLAESSE